MVRAVLILLQIAIVVAIAVWLADNPGVVHIEWQNRIVDTSFGVLLAAVALIVALAIGLYAILRSFRRAPYVWAERRRTKRRERGYRALTLGMVAVAAGDAEEARRQQRRADVLLDEPPLNLLLSAQTSQLEGDDEAARRYFTAMLDRPETAFLGQRGLLMQARRDDDHGRALQIAEQANRQRPGTPWVLEALFDLQVRSGNWAEAELTLESMRRHRLIGKPDMKHRQAVLRTERGRLEAARGNNDRALQLAQEAQKLDPALVPAAVDLIRLSHAAGNQRRAERVADLSWRRNPHPAVARAVADLHADLSPLERYRRFQKLAKAAPDHPETRFLLAEAAIEAELWGEARAQLRPLVQENPSARACRLMAEVETGEHGDAAAARSWLARASEAEPDPVWVCSECGAVAAEWTPLCHSCGAFDTLAWRVPDHVPPLTLRPPVLLHDAPAITTVEDAAAEAEHPPGEHDERPTEEVHPGRS